MYSPVAVGIRLGESISLHVATDRFRILSPIQMIRRAARLRLQDKYQNSTNLADC